MNIMADRLRYLQQIIDGFLQTKTPLLLFDGKSLFPFFTFDDIGIYVFIPQLVRFFGITLDQAINIFFYGFLTSSFLLGLIGFLLLYKSAITKFIATTGLLLLFYFVIKFEITDVYLAYLASAVSIIPLSLYFTMNNTKSILFYFFTIFSGLIVGTSHYIRAYSGLAPLIFLIILLIFNSTINGMKKFLLLICIVLGMTGPYYYFNQIIHQNKQFAEQHFPDSNQIIHQHVFWHPIYLGFGFLNCMNEDNIQYKDSFGLEKAKKHNPAISFEKTKEYEEIIKNETFLLWKKQPWFVLFTIFAKIGVLLFFFLLFSNFGSIAAFCFPKPWYIEVAFLASFGINALFPLLAVPYIAYSIGFIAVATLYGIVSINHAISFINFKKIIENSRRLISNIGIQ